MRPPEVTRPPTSPPRRSGVVWRWLPTPVPRGDDAGQSARAVLGPAHPLSRAIAAATGVGRQWVTCAAILAGSIIALLEGHRWATILIASSMLVLAALSVLLLTLKQRVSDRAIDLIAGGRETLPITTVQRHRQRLLARRRRTTLANNLETMIRQATARPKIITRGSRPLFDTRVIALVATELRAVIRLLQSTNPPARGVALTDRLITDGHSPCYGHEVNALRDELDRILQALEH
jgi:hypothetical protein